MKKSMKQLTVETDEDRCVGCADEFTNMRGAGMAMPRSRKTGAGQREIMAPVIVLRTHTTWSSLLCIVVFSVLWLAVGLPCSPDDSRPEPRPKADSQFDLMPMWVRPEKGTLVCVHLKGNMLPAGGKRFLRLTQERSDKSCPSKSGAGNPGPRAIADLPLDDEQLRKGLVEAMFTGPLRRGDYEAIIVDEVGKPLVSGPKNFRVRATKAPPIDDIMPNVIYPTNDRYDFEITGSEFSHYNRDEIKLRINDVPVKFTKCLCYTENRDAAHDCPGSSTCLIWNWRTLRIVGLSLTKESFENGRVPSRPFKISVEADQSFSDPHLLVLSRVGPYTPRIIAIILGMVIVLLVYWLCKEKVARSRAEGSTYRWLAYLFIDPQTNTYSLSKLQLIFWTVASVLAYSYLSVSQFLVQSIWVLPNVPEGLPMLLGLSAGTTVLSVATTGLRGSKGAGASQPERWNFITTGGVFAPERLQFLIWTILGATGFVVTTFLQDPGSVTAMPRIPEYFTTLMGASAVGYLGGKLARKPGPIIKDVHQDTHDPNSLVIVGQNLSSDSQVKIGKDQLPPGRVKPGPNEPENTEFISELIVTIGRDLIVEIGGMAEADKPKVKIINPDGQSAEKVVAAGL
jgi:hypothetical protein